MTKILSIICLTVLIVGLGCKKNIRKNRPDNNTQNSNNQNNQVVEKVKEKYIGTFKFGFSTFHGKLKLIKQNNTYAGSLIFKNWGNGKEHPLKNVRINKNKIYFERSVLTEKEKKKYNSRRFFKQVFYGIFNKDGSIIKGRCKLSGDWTDWTAFKVK